MPARCYYPIYLDVADQTVLVVGGGAQAVEKVRVMLGHGARVRWVESTDPAGEALLGHEGLDSRRRAFEPADLEGCSLVFCATGDRATDRRVSEAARVRGVPVNVVDVPELCSFIVPSILRRGNLSLAVSTDGLCPSFSRHVRQSLEEVIDPAYGEALEVLSDIRSRVYDAFEGREYEVKRRVMEQVLALDVPDLVRTRGADAAREAALEVVAREVVTRACLRNSE